MQHLPAIVVRIVVAQLRFLHDLRHGETNLWLALFLRIHRLLFLVRLVELLDVRRLLLDNFVRNGILKLNTIKDNTDNN
jgi:hypothetical protein